MRIHVIYYNQKEGEPKEAPTFLGSEAVTRLVKTLWS